LYGSEIWSPENLLKNNQSISEWTNNLQKKVIPLSVWVYSGSNKTIYQLCSEGGIGAFSSCYRFNYVFLEIL
jgi:hypothetical protein